MKTFHILGIVFLFTTLVLVLIIVAFNQPMASAQNLSAAAFHLQINPTPVQSDASEIGSTDGILILGFVIMTIIVVPIIVHKRKK
jgi:hypothetical protein